MKLLVIVPAFNEAESIGPLIASLRENGYEDILVIDDASTDNSRKIVQENNVLCVSLPINLGIGGAVQTGFRYAFENSYDFAVQVDGDGQHDSSYIPELLTPILSGKADVVVGSRFIFKEGYQSSMFRRAGISVLQIVFFILSGRKLTDITSGFRAYGSKAIAYLAENYSIDFPEPESCLSLLKKGFRIIEVTVLMNPRKFGKSSIRGGKSIYYICKVIISMIIERFRR